jgi:hypothetical protein
MTTEEKKRGASILSSHENSFSVACVMQLHTDLRVQMSDMQLLRVCLEAAAADPSHLERGDEDVQIAVAASSVLAAAQAAQPDVAQGLINFQLNPKAKDGTPLFTGMALFEHMVKKARRSVPARQTLAPSAHLDIEYTGQQQQLLDPLPVDFAMHQIIATTHGEGAKKSMAKRKLDSLGNVRGECGWANDPQRLAKLTNQLNLADSISEISKDQSRQAAAIKSSATAELVDLAPGAILTLASKQGDVGSLTKDEIRAIAFVHYNGTMLKKADNKKALIEAFSQLSAGQPSTLPALTAAATVAPEQQQLQLSHQKPAARGADASSSAARLRREEDSSEEDFSEEDSSEEEAGEEAEEEAGTHAR